MCCSYTVLHEKLWLYIFHFMSILKNFSPRGNCPPPLHPLNVDLVISSGQFVLQSFRLSRVSSRVSCPFVMPSRDDKNKTKYSHVQRRTVGKAIFAHLICRSQVHFCFHYYSRCYFVYVRFVLHVLSRSIANRKVSTVWFLRSNNSVIQFNYSSTYMIILFIYGRSYSETWIISRPVFQGNIIRL
jgi:hypothetical protein